MFDATLGHIVAETNVSRQSITALWIVDVRYVGKESAGQPAVPVTECTEYRARIMEYEIMFS